MSVSRAISTPCLSTCPMMHPGTASCGTYDRLRIEPAHNVRLGRCFHSDRTHASPTEHTQATRRRRCADPG